LSTKVNSRRSAPSGPAGRRSPAPDRNTTAPSFSSTVSGFRPWPSRHPSARRATDTDVPRRSSSRSQ